MRRDVFLNVNATGMDTVADRMIEVVALEALDSKLTGVQFQVLLDPRHPMDHMAEMVTGYDNEQLEGLPTFGDIAQKFLNFVKDSDLIVFNSHWGFLLVDAELERLNLPPLAHHTRHMRSVKSSVMKPDLNIKLSLDKLAVLFDCREPVQSCSPTWKDCFMLAQVFSRLDGDVDPLMNIVQLETLVPVHAGPYGTQYIEIATIPEPWKSQFMRWLCAGELTGDVRIHRCHQHHWAEWLNQASAQCPELAPSQLDEFPFSWFDMRTAMTQGYQRARLHLKGKCVRYPSDLEREMRYQSALAGYGAQEKTLHKTFIRGFQRCLAKTA